MMLKAFAPRAPELTIDTYRNMENDPETIRWRAGWSSDYSNEVEGIELRAYPVIRRTPQGAWVDPHAYHHGAWQLSGSKRWVSDTGGAAWAKPTKEDALFSIAYRFSRWSSRLHNDINYYFAVAHALGVLLPGQKFRADDGKSLVRAAVLDRAGS